MTTVVATSERLAIPDEELFELSPEQLRKATLKLTADWHPKLQELFTRADAFFPIKIRASERVDPWRPGPVTLLGDAIHTMPPTGGVGANTALQDAATLAHELLHEDQPLTDAVAAYERAMLPRGFNTVTNSMMMADQLFTRT
jgi:2-polyprenyl-6-methoxyphenol hydroxylase-like FAD-dependent oxidoreductase